jgi:hypothetical protein
MYVACVAPAPPAACLALAQLVARCLSAAWRAFSRRSCSLLFGRLQGLSGRLPAAGSWSMLPEFWISGPRDTGLF